jgi:hypothetical protein
LEFIFSKKSPDEKNLFYFDFILSLRPLKQGKRDRWWGNLPDSIRYLFYQNVVFQIGVPNNRPVIAYAWSTANIDATLIV